MNATSVTPRRAALSYAFLIFVGITMAFPLIWMLATSLKSQGEINAQSDGFLAMLLPRSLHPGNYSEVFHLIPFARYYFNSTVVALTVSAGQVFTSACAAYAFARVQWRGRDRIFLCYLGTMMIPGAVTMIPNFILLRYLPDAAAHFLGPWWNAYLVGPGPLSSVQLGRAVGTDSYFALIVPSMFSAYGTFMLRQFFLGISKEYDEAASIDGAGHWRIFTKIILPLSRTSLATLAIFTFMGNWRSFMWPLINTHRDYLKTLPVGIQAFLGLYSTQWSFLMAASMMMILPMIVIFLLGQRYFISGIQLGGVKG